MVQTLQDGSCCQIFPPDRDINWSDAGIHGSAVILSKSMVNILKILKSKKIKKSIY